MSDDITRILEEVFRSVVTAMDRTAEITVTSGDDGVIGITVSGEDLEALVGREGAVIDALQYLAHQIVVRHSDGPGGRVALDVAGYRERRRQQLEKLAEHAANEAVTYGEEIELDAMTPHDRRIVHMALAERTDVVTRSEGQEPRRRIVVEPAVDGDGDGEAGDDA